jgi:hypothetical protein
MRGSMPTMAAHAFDDPALEAAMRAFVAADAALSGAVDEPELLRLSDAKAVAGLQLRKRLVELGWTAPVRQRSTR